MKIVFIHGIGQDESAWFPVIRQLNGLEALTYSYNDVIRDSKIPQYKHLRQDLQEYLSNMDEPYILCGISIGGKLVIDLANELGDLLKGIILVSTNYNEKKSASNKLKLGMMSVLPKKTFSKNIGLSKDQVMGVLSSVRDMDLSRQLTTFRKPTLIIVGSQDKSAVKAGREMTDLLLHHQLVVIPKGIHELNESHPEEIGREIQAFVDGL